MTAYAVNKLCFLLGRSPEFRARLAGDPGGTLAEFEPRLSEEEQAALRKGEVGVLRDLGAHDFLLYNLFRFEVAGLDLSTYVARMKSAGA